jgi:hypothetical protein
MWKNAVHACLKRVKIEKIPFIYETPKIVNICGLDQTIRNRVIKDKTRSTRKHLHQSMW